VKQSSAAFLLLVVASCATPTTTTAPSAPATAPVAQPAAVPAAASPNRLTPTAAQPRAIVEPRIRVGLLSDQSRVEFPRTK
jgi:hypothetical protein